VSTIPTEVDDKINNLETLYQNLPTGACVANFFGIGTCDGFYHQTFQRNPTLRNLEPRIGFAWDPFHTGKTSVRGGFGIFDVLPLSYMFALNSLQTAPNGAEIDLKFVGNAGQGHFPTLLAADTTNPALVSNSGAAARWTYADPFPKRNYVMQWNFNIQRQITPTTSVTLAYAGSRGFHNPFQTDDLNIVFPTLSSAGWLFPNPIGSGCMNQAGKASTAPDCSGTDLALGLPATFNSNGQISNNPAAIVPGLLINSNVAQIQSTIFTASSWYNALQVAVAKRMSHGFQLGGNFTWGKSIDTSSSSFAGDNYSNNPSAIIPWWDSSAIKGLSDFNVTRNVVINGLWQVPTPASFRGPAGWIARGWGLGAVFEASDGIPLWPLSGLDGDALGMLNGGPYDIPSYVPGCTLTNPSSGRSGALQYINPSCYVVAQAPSQAFANTNCDQNPPFGPKGAKVSLASLGVPPLTCFNLLGNLGRNTVIGPALINVDYSMVKDNHISALGEAFNIQFRAEFFNITNRVNYAPPIANNLQSLTANGAAASNFGVLTKTQVPMREIQFALKMIW
jgi:hypothetical protein